MSSDNDQNNTLFQLGKYDYARLINAVAGKSQKQGGLNKADVQEILRLNAANDKGTVEELRKRLAALLPTKALDGDEDGSSSDDDQNNTLFQLGKYDYARLINAVDGKSHSADGLNKEALQDILRLNDADDKGTVDELRKRLAALLPTKALDGDEDGSSSDDDDTSSDNNGSSSDEEEGSSSDEDSDEESETSSDKTDKYIQRTADAEAAFKNTTDDKVVKEIMFRKECLQRDEKEYQLYETWKKNQKAIKEKRKEHMANHLTFYKSEDEVYNKNLIDEIVTQLKLGMAVNTLHRDSCSSDDDSEFKQFLTQCEALKEAFTNVLTIYENRKVSLMNVSTKEMTMWEWFHSYLWKNNSNNQTIFNDIVVTKILQWWEQERSETDVPEQLYKILNDDLDNDDLDNYELDNLNTNNQSSSVVDAALQTFKKSKQKFTKTKNSLFSVKSWNKEQWKWRTLYRYLPSYIDADAVLAAMETPVPEEGRKVKIGGKKLFYYTPGAVNYTPGAVNYNKFFKRLDKIISKDDSPEAKVCRFKLRKAWPDVLPPIGNDVLLYQSLDQVPLKQPYSAVQIEWFELKKKIRNLYFGKPDWGYSPEQMQLYSPDQMELLNNANDSNTDETDDETDDDTNGYSDFNFDAFRANEAMDKIIRDNVGMDNIKQQCLQLYSNRLAQITETDAAQPELPLNFQFIGNPGTGKTTIARLMADVLFYTGLRPTPKPVQMPQAPTASSPGGIQMPKITPFDLINPLQVLWKFAKSNGKKTGKNTEKYKAEVAEYKSELAKMPPPGPYLIEESGASLLVKGAKSFMATIDSMVALKGGILFIDEAYSLDPMNDDDGKKIFDLIMTTAENYRNTITIVLAGYRKDIESKLNMANPGLPRRFPSVFDFHDYSDEELFQIMQLILKKTRDDKDPQKFSGWFIKDKVGRVLIRRIARQRGVYGFGNAGTVRNQIYDKIIKASVRLELGTDKLKPNDSTNNILEVTIEDVIGPNPNQNPTIKQLSDRLEKDFVGLAKVKNEIKNLIDVAKKNWEREKNCLRPFPVMLNRLFVGNPGTGKTSIAAIYGSILSALGYLSDGSVRATVASDYIGSAMGETQQKTVAMLESCKGKILIIDEAYVLSQSSYGKQALDVLVERVSPKPGADMAVILAGYPANILKMCREENPGLGRRFDVSHPIVFEDYNDKELEFILERKCRKERIICKAAVRKAAIAKLAMQRQQPSFGNAGAVENMFSRAKRNAIEKTNNVMLLELTKKNFDIEDDVDVNDLIEKLGNEKMKTHVQQLQSMVHYYEKKVKGRGANDKRSKTPKAPGHYIITGNSGTGKTCLSTQLGQIFFKLGFLSSSKMVITSAPDLMGSVVGEAQKIVRKKMEEALGGTLFIDEAYQLGKGSYGEEAQTQLIATLEEDKYKSNIIVILAGYQDEMNEMLARNQGMRSRFTNVFHLEDWNTFDCVELVSKELTARYCTLTEDGKEQLTRTIDALIAPRNSNFANGRDCINIAKIISLYAYGQEATEQANDADIPVNGQAVETSLVEFVHQRHSNGVRTVATPSGGGNVNPEFRAGQGQEMKTEAGDGINTQPRTALTETKTSDLGDAGDAAGDAADSEGSSTMETKMKEQASSQTRRADYRQYVM